MDKQQKISHLQIGVLFFVFMTGSSIINIPGPLIARASNGAWLSLLISGGLGMFLLACILFLQRRYPGLTFVEYSRKLIGPWLTAALSIVTLSFLVQMESAIVVDVSLFMITSMLRETPMYAFTSLIFMVSALTVRAGIEVMARMFTLIMLVAAVLIAMVLLFALPEYEPAFLLPVMPDGIKPVLHGAYFTFGFPYAEVFLFSMLFPFAAQSSSGQLSRTMVYTLMLNIFTLSVASLAAIMVFGPYAGERPYALFALARIVEFEEVIQRVESITGMALIVGSYMKTSITLYVLSLYLTQLFRFKDYRTCVMPLALIGFLLTLVGFDSATEWAEIVTVIHPVWASAAFVVPLLLVTAAALFKRE